MRGKWWLKLYSRRRAGAGVSACKTEYPVHPARYRSGKEIVNGEGGGNVLDDGEAGADVVSRGTGEGERVWGFWPAKLKAERGALSFGLV